MPYKQSQLKGIKENPQNYSKVKFLSILVAIWRRGSFFVDSHLEINSRKKSLDKRNTTGNKTQVKGKQDLFLPLSWSIKSS